MITHCIVFGDNVINIGPWTPIIETLADGSKVLHDSPPAGSIEGEFDIDLTADGRYVLATNYQELRKAEYPPIGDQLDALYHAGVFPPEMASLLAQVKEKYEKNK